MKKQQVFYIHGGSAYSDYADFLKYLKNTNVEPFSEKEKRWADSLARELGEDFEVFSPTMPNKYNAKYKEWKIWFERHFEFLHDDIVLLGWSLGAMFLVKYLMGNELPFSVKRMFLLATPLHYFKDIETGEDGGDFNLDVERVVEVSEKIKASTVIIHSEDDFVVPIEHSIDLKSAWSEAELITYKDKNHFLIPEFPELIGLLKMEK